MLSACGGFLDGNHGSRSARWTHNATQLTDRVLYPHNDSQSFHREIPFRHQSKQKPDTPPSNLNAPPPAYIWPKLATDRSGLDPKKLDVWWKLLRQNKTDSIFLMKDDKIVFKCYVNGFERCKIHYTASSTVLQS